MEQMSGTEWLNHWGRSEEDRRAGPIEKLLEQLDNTGVRREAPRFDVRA
jgi:hypothetical protein